MAPHITITTVVKFPQTMEHLVVLTAIGGGHSNIQPSPSLELLLRTLTTSSPLIPTQFYSWLTKITCQLSRRS